MNFDSLSSLHKVEWQSFDSHWYGKSKKYIQKVVKKVVNNYANKKYHNDYFDLERYLDAYDNTYCGYGSLLVKKAKNEWVHITNWDCVILDEYHFGSWRENAKELFKI